MADGSGQRVVIPYAPRQQQLLVHAACESTRFVVVVAHRRFGKTVLAINKLVKAALTNRRERPRCYYIAPTLKQAKQVAWDYLLHYTAPIPGVAVNISETRVDLPNGSRVTLAGADDPDSLRGLYMDDIVLDEVGMMEPRTWSEVCRPALADRQGKALFIGTPNGQNLFFDLRNTAEKGGDFKLLEFRASDTKILPQSELDAARSVMSPDEYLQEFECSFEASVKGAIYADELRTARDAKRITRVPYDPVVPVDTAWDLGIGDSTSIWFVQQVGNEVRLIDYYEASGEGLPHYAAVLQQRGYVYGTHIAPHDIQVRELGSGRSRIETARSLGLNFAIAPKVSFDDGIHAVRMMFPRFYFDMEKCGVGLEALSNYRKDYNTRIGEFKPTPVHDWSSHGADALRYLALGLKPKQEFKPIRYPSMGIV
jgi:phage terminase large subunit